MTKTNTKKPIRAGEAFEFTVGKKEHSKKFTKQIMYWDYLDIVSETQRRTKGEPGWTHAIDNFLDICDMIKCTYHNIHNGITAFNIYLYIVWTLKSINRRIRKASHYHINNVDYYMYDYWNNDEVFKQMADYIQKCLENRHYYARYIYHEGDKFIDEYSNAEFYISWEEEKNDDN